MTVIYVQKLLLTLGMAEEGKGLWPNDALDYGSVEDGHLSQIEWVVSKEFLGSLAKGKMIEVS